MKIIYQGGATCARCFPSDQVFRTLFVCLSLLILPTPILAATVNGFVTQVSSPTEFNVGTLHIIMSGKTQCKTEGFRFNIQLKSTPSYSIFAHHYVVLQSRHAPASTRSTPCDRLALTIGSRVKIIGDAKEPGGEVLATGMILYAVEIRQTIVGKRTHLGWTGGALLEEKPQMSRKGHGWVGTIWLDGYPMRITPDTKLLTAPVGTQMSYGEFGFLNDPRMGAIVSRLPSPAFSAVLFQPNSWATYRGVGLEDSRVLLDRIRLWPNHIGSTEKKYWAQTAPTIRAPNYVNRVPGRAQFAHEKNVLAIIPDQSVQDFVSKLGMSLVPHYQKVLPDSDKTKIHFRFYVVHPIGKGWNDEARRLGGLLSLQQPGWVEPMIAFPDGIVLIVDGALAKIDNEAQLSSMLSCAITAVLQKQSYIPRHPHVGLSLDEEDQSSWLLVFAVSRNEQMLRIGIRQMYLAGYDIRDAPFAWAVAQGKPINNPVINSKHPDKEIPWYAAYAFNYISQYYKDVDYSKLKRGEKEYQQFLQELRKADPEAFASQPGSKPAAKAH